MSMGFLHAHNSFYDRWILWRDVSNISNDRMLFMSDFNAVIGAHEGKGGGLPIDVLCREFSAFMKDMDFHSVSTAGGFFTWSSHRRGVLCHARLDRIIYHSPFVSLWSSKAGTLLARIGSGHHPIMIMCVNNLLNGPLLFKFRNYWSNIEGFMTTVNNSWQEDVEYAHPIKRMMIMLKILRSRLRSWNKNKVGNINTQISDVQAELLAEQDILL